MLKNQKQYETTKAAATRFEAALASLDDAASDLHPTLLLAERQSLESQLQDLHQEIAEYESLRSRKRRVLELTALSELPAALISGRIAAGLTHRDLADRLRCKEQQIQRYEATNYAGASLARIQEVMDAIGIGI